MNNDSLYYHKLISSSSARGSLKSFIDYRVGDLAVSKMIDIVEDYFYKISRYAKTSLDIENENRKKNGLIPRKTLQNIDIERALMRYKGEIDDIDDFY